MPWKSRGFCVAMTRNGRGTGRLTPSAVTWRSSITSSSADWVFGLPRLISSPINTLVNTGPSRNENVPAALVEHHHAGDVARQQVGGELDPLPRAGDRSGDRLGEAGLAGPRHVVEEQVTLGEQAAQRETDLVASCPVRPGRRCRSRRRSPERRSRPRSASVRVTPFAMGRRLGRRGEPARPPRSTDQSQSMRTWRSASVSAWASSWRRGTGSWTGSSSGMSGSSAPSGTPSRWASRSTCSGSGASAPAVRCRRRSRHPLAHAGARGVPCGGVRSECTSVRCPRVASGDVTLPASGAISGSPRVAGRRVGRRARVGATRRATRARAATRRSCVNIAATTCLQA